MSDAQKPTTEIIQSEQYEAHLTDALAKHADSKVRTTIRNLLRESFNLHKILCDHIGDS